MDEQKECVSMKIVYITGQNIHKANFGGGQCAQRNYNAIKSILDEKDELYTCMISADSKLELEDHELHIPAIKNKIASAFAALWGSKCCKRKYEKYIWRFMDGIKPDLVYLDTSKLGKFSKRIKRKYGSRVIVFFHNVEADYSMHFVQNRGYQYLLAYWSSLWNERIAVKYGDKLICLNERDGKRIEELYGRKPDAVVPISFMDRYKEEKVAIDKDKGLLFVGSLFPPNYDGINWFIDNVMMQLPEYFLTIVGKDFEKKRKELERDNVKVVGTVDDLEDYYYTYPVMVMPIQYGAGMKVKTAEAMMYGKIILATDEALEGYNLPEQCGIIRCNTSEEFVNAIQSVMTDKLNYNNTKGRELFLQNYEFGVTQKQFERLIKEERE